MQLEAGDIIFILLMQLLSLYSSEVNGNLQVCVALCLPEVPCYPLFTYLLK